MSHVVGATTRVMTMITKLIKSRREYKCSCCKGTIAKGDLYSRKSERIGSSKADTAENHDGVLCFVSHGYTLSLKHCLKCSTVKEAI